MAPGGCALFSWCCALSGTADNDNSPDAANSRRRRSKLKTALTRAGGKSGGSCSSSSPSTAAAAATVGGKHRGGTSGSGSGGCAVVKCGVCKCASESGSRSVYMHLMPPEVKQLHVAVMRNDLRTVHSLVQQKVDVNFAWVSEPPDSCSVKHGISPLCEAVALNHTDIALALIEAGAHVNQVDAKGMTPLCRACHFGNERLVARLVQAGARVNLSRDLEKSPLWFAILCLSQCKAGLLPQYASVIRILLDAGAEVRQPNVAGGKSALHVVSSFMIAPLVPLLLEYGASVDCTDMHFHTPLFDCITHSAGRRRRHLPHSQSVHRHRQYAVAEQLISAGCDDVDLAVWIDSSSSSCGSGGVLEEIERSGCCPWLAAWCRLHLARPLPLKNLCRLAIHSHLGGVLQTALALRVSCLHLPPTLTHYLCRATLAPLFSSPYSPSPS